MFRIGFILFLSFVSLDGAIAHPVSYAGSIGVMGDHSPTLAHNQLNYSMRHWLAFGVHHFRRPDLDEPRHATLMSANLLLKRWNTDSFQANIYAVLGGGQSELSGRPETAGLGLIQFDIEDREYYFLAKHLQIFSDERAELEQSAVRMGVAPYADPFDGLHMWLILEGQRYSFGGENEKYDVTPFLRVFYRNLLFEIGQSFNGATKFNYISHF